MVRPRLVEVGQPLSASGSGSSGHHEGAVADVWQRDGSSDSSSDHSMTDADHHPVQTHSQLHASEPGASGRDVPASSLQLALGSTYSSEEQWRRQSQRDRRSFRTVVGGTTDAPVDGFGRNGGSAAQRNSSSCLKHREPQARPSDVSNQRGQQPLTLSHPFTLSHQCQNNSPSADSQISYLSYVPSTVAHATHIEIGADLRPMERMEGVEDHGSKAPLVVIDGANVAYEYGKTLAHSVSRPVADTRGIQVACQYFQAHGLRVLVVLTSSWLRLKPQPGDPNPSSARMHTSELDVLHELKEQGLLVLAPPTDDDDAYAITIARRELSRPQHLYHPNIPAHQAFILSNDLFRDAQQRDATLANWLQKGISAESGPGRVSYLFCNMGSLDDHGERILDFVPNPRHPLVVWIEQQQSHRAKSNNN